MNRTLIGRTALIAADECVSRVRASGWWNHTVEVDVPTTADLRVQVGGGVEVPMSCRLIMCAIASAVLLTSCGSDQPSDAEKTAYADSAPPAGEAVDYFVYTHCGVESLKVDGRWWHAVDPLYGDNGPGDSPDGWGDPYQEGEMTLNSEDSITFEAKGKAVEFVPAPENKPMRVCR